MARVSFKASKLCHKNCSCDVASRNQTLTAAGQAAKVDQEIVSEQHSLQEWYVTTLQWKFESNRTSIDKDMLGDSPWHIRLYYFYISCFSFFWGDSWEVSVCMRNEKQRQKNTSWPKCLATNSAWVVRPFVNIVNCARHLSSIPILFTIN